MKVALAGLAGAVVLAAPASADVLEVGDDGVVRTRTSTPEAGWETPEEKAAASAASAAVAAERKALMIEAAMSAPMLGAPAPATVAPVTNVNPALIARATLTQLRHVPPALLGSLLAAAQKYDLSPLLLDAVARQESGYRVDARSRVGAIGVMQLMPGTARLMGVDPHDPHANIDGGARYLRRMLDRFGGNVALALAAYNAGPGRVERTGGVPRIAETQNYVSKIMTRLANGAAAATMAVAQLATVTTGD